jgi:hypothetical protein
MPPCPSVCTDVIHAQENNLYLWPMVTSFNNMLKPKENDVGNAPDLLYCHYHLIQYFTPLLQFRTKPYWKQVDDHGSTLPLAPLIHGSHKSIPGAMAYDDNPCFKNVLLESVPLIYCRLILFIMLINIIIFCCKVQRELIDSIIFEVPKLFVLQGSPYLLKT